MPKPEPRWYCTYCDANTDRPTCGACGHEARRTLDADGRDRFYPWAKPTEHKAAAQNEEGGGLG